MLAPENIDIYEVKAATLITLGHYQDAIVIYRELVVVLNEKALCLLRLGNVLKIVGNAIEAVECYQEAIAINPLLGEAFWSLANLKTYCFTTADIVVMRSALQSKKIDNISIVLINFTLGKAFEEQQQFALSFDHYQQANQRYAQDGSFRYSSQKEKLATFFNQNYFENKIASGHQSEAPVFIVGLPRSGSTLVEQILASHGQVDGTMELTEIISIARELNTQNQLGQGQFFQSMEKLSDAQIQGLAQRYLDYVQPLRQNVPLFIDKLPNNFHHIGLIKTLFPQAKIIDVRRNPMASSWSLYKHFFAEGHDFSYNLRSIGQYYNDYVALMAHW